MDQVEQQREFKFGVRYACCFVVDVKGPKDEPGQEAEDAEDKQALECTKEGMPGSYNRAINLKLERKHKATVRLEFTDLVPGRKGARRTFTLDGAKTSKTTIETHFGDGLEVSIAINCEWCTLVSRAYHRIEGLKINLLVPVATRGSEVLQQLGWDNHSFELIIMPRAIPVPGNQLLAFFGDALGGPIADTWLYVRETRR